MPLFRTTTQRFEEFDSRLSDQYGSDLSIQRRRYREALSRFKATYPSASVVSVVRAPGRVTIAGQHNDYNHAQILNLPIRQDILVLAAARLDNRIVLSNMDPDYAPAEFTIDQSDSRDKLRSDLRWTDYLHAMTIQMTQLARHWGACLFGMNVLVDGRVDHGGLPARAGLGSSSALLSAYGIVCAHLAQPRLELTAAQLATAAMNSENALGFPSGVQDPMGSLNNFGTPRLGNVALLIDPLPRHKAGEPHFITRSVPLPHQIRLLLVHTGTPKPATAWNEFNVRADEAKLSSWLIGHWLLERHPGFFADLTIIPSAYPDLAQAERTLYPPFWRPFYFTRKELYRAGLLIPAYELHRLVNRLPSYATRSAILGLGMPIQVYNRLTAGSRAAGEPMERRPLNLRGSFLHVITEQERVTRAIVALEHGRLSELAELQKEIYYSLDRNYRAVSPAAKALVANIRLIPGILAARPLGGIWSSMVAIWHSEDAQPAQLMEKLAACRAASDNCGESERFALSTTSSGGAGLIFELGS